VVVCGGIEKRFYDYLTWKKVLVLDSVMGPLENVLKRLSTHSLAAGAVLHDREDC